jgi:hypothetical protein
MKLALGILLAWLCVGAQSILAAKRVVLPLPVPPHVTRVGAGSGCDYVELQAAIDAAALRSGPDSIEIARDQTYAAQALVIEDPDFLELVGGFEVCGSLSDDLPTTISGAGGIAATVIAHRGFGPLSLQRLRVADGDASDGAGGVSSTGIAPFSGASGLRLYDVVFEDNVGTSAGGLLVEGQPPALKPVLFAGVVRFERNRGDQGGAIAAYHSELRPGLEPQLTIQGNVASVGDGGGMLLLNSVLREGFGCPFLVRGNTAARHGGGMSLQARGGVALADLRPRRPCPHQVEENVAAATGGAFHVWADASAATPIGTSSRVDLRLLDTVVSANQAIDGGAVMLRSSAEGLRWGEATVTMDATVPFGSTEPVACSDRPLGLCSVLESNATAPWFGGTPPPPEGAPLAVVSEGKGAGHALLWIAHTSIRFNSGRHALRLDGPNASAHISDSLVADNETWDAMIEGRNQAQLTIARSTMIHESSFSGAAMRGDSEFLVERSIAMFPGQQPLALRQAGNDGWLRDVMVDAGGFGLVGHLPRTRINIIETTDAGFVDRASQGCRLRADSPAIDRWIPFSGEHVGRDLELSVRGIDLAEVEHEPGQIFDLGACEYDQRLFDDGFE